MRSRSWTAAPKHSCGRSRSNRGVLIAMSTREGRAVAPGAVALACWWMAAAAAQARAADDRIELRNTQVVNGTVAAFDPDGVQLAGRPQPIGWDEIERARLGRDQER